MRKRRAILFDDDPVILDVLSLFFEERDYDVLSFTEPVSCAIYEADGPCGRERPCADVVITDLLMPGMSGIALLESQARRGCPLAVENKAILSGSLDPAVLESIRRLGCAWFRKPFRAAQLDAWLRECEPRMDLARPLGALRREPREACGAGRHLTLGTAEGEIPAEVVNASPSGLCLRVGRPLAVEQTLHVRAPRAVGSERLTVRWTKAHAGGYLAGASSS